MNYTKEEELLYNEFIKKEFEKGSVEKDNKLTLYHFRSNRCSTVYKALTEAKDAEFYLSISASFTGQAFTPSVVKCTMAQSAEPLLEKWLPSERELIYSRVIQKGLDFSINNQHFKLNERYWVVTVDIHVIKDNGNIIDLAYNSIIKVLSNFTLPFDFYKIPMEQKTKIVDSRSRSITYALFNKTDQIYFAGQKGCYDSADSSFIIFYDENDRVVAGELLKPPIKIDLMKKILKEGIEESKIYPSLIEIKEVDEYFTEEDHYESL